MTDTEEVGGFLFTNAYIIDGYGESPFHGSILIKGNKIEDVFVGHPPNGIQGVEEVDLKGFSVLPGLIDMHVHLTVTGDGLSRISGQEKTPTPLYHTLEVKKACEDTLKAGFTTVRDAAGSPQELREAIESGHFLGPRMLLTVQMLSQTGGHGDGFPCDSNGVGHPLGRVCDGIDECVKATRTVIKEGADWVKVASGGGVTSKGNASVNCVQFTAQELRAIVEVAKLADRKVMAHAHTPKAIEHAVKAGVGTVEHGTLITPELIELMIEKKCALVPTLAILHRVNERMDSLPPSVQQKAKEVERKAKVCVSAALAASDRLMIGSGSDALGDLHGDNGKELYWKTQYGFTPMQAIVSATRINAEILGMGDRIGTIERGKIADLVIVRGDPSTDIRCVSDPRNVILVIKDGVVVHNLLQEE